MGKNLTLDGFSQTGFVKTASYSGITDSAAAATAMATGQKVFNGEVANHNNADLATFLDAAKLQGKKIGVISSDNLYGATPASFSAHARNRGQTETIINSQISSNIDLLMGQGVTTYNGYAQAISSAGYDYVTNFANLNAVANKVFGVFESIDPNEIASANSVNISALASFALNFLNNENGFVLVLEVSDIDKRSHDNNYQEMIYELLMLDELVQTVLNWIGQSNETFLMVTADHETAGLTLQDGVYQFDSTSHTNNDVPFYALNYNLNETLIDNTDIYNILRFLITKEQLAL